MGNVGKEAMLLSKAPQAPNLKPVALHSAMPRPSHSLKHENGNICFPVASHLGNPIAEAGGGGQSDGPGTVASQPPTLYLPQPQG